MSQKSIPQEVLSGVAQIPKDVAMELVEQGSGGLIQPKQANPLVQQSTNDQQVKKQIEELQKKEQTLQDTEVPNAQWILKNQGEERQMLNEEKEEKRQKELQEIREQHEKKAQQQESLSGIGTLAASGSKKTARDQFVKKSPEPATKQGM